jgi:hypothetical protein
MTELGFPPPWSLDELDACFVVTDSTRQKLAYVYFEDDPGRRSASCSAAMRHYGLQVRFARLLELVDWTHGRAPQGDRLRE